jgi:hypothetical protein
MINRTEVWKAIDSERDYQDFRWNPSTSTSGGQHTVSEWILYMEAYLHEARQKVSTQASPKAEEEALECLRKVTAMGVACMEQNGAPQRKGFER